MLSAYFIRASDDIEASCSDWRRELGLEAGGIEDIQPAFVETDGENET